MDKIRDVNSVSGEKLHDLEITCPARGCDCTLPPFASLGELSLKTLSLNCVVSELSRFPANCTVLTGEVRNFISLYRAGIRIGIGKFTQPYDLRVLTRILKTGVKMLPSRKSWSFTINTFLLRLCKNVGVRHKSWELKVGVNSKFEVNVKS